MLNPGVLKLASIPLFGPVRQSFEVGAPPVSAGRVTLEVVALRVILKFWIFVVVEQMMLSCRVLLSQSCSADSCSVEYEVNFCLSFRTMKVCNGQQSDA